MKYVALISAIALFWTGWTSFAWLALGLALWMHLLFDDKELLP